MGEEPGRTDHCHYLTDVLDSAPIIEELEPWEITMAHRHWEACQFCRNSHPDAPRWLAQFQRAVERTVTDVLEKFKKESVASKAEVEAEVARLDSLADSILRAPIEDEKESLPLVTSDAESGEIDDFLWISESEARRYQKYEETLAQKESQKARLIVRAIEHGRQIKFLLDYVHGSIQGFSVLADKTDDEQMSAWEGSKVFISSLALDTQRFVFSSCLMLELADYAREEWGQMEEPERVNLVLSKLPFQIDRFLEIAALSSRKALEDYLKESPPTPPDGKVPVAEPTTGDVVQIAQINEKLNEIRAEMLDGVDSIKAGQMETHLRTDRISRRVGEYEPLLKDQLGSEVYQHLSEDSRKSLCLAEYAYKNNLEPDGFSGAVLYYVAALENQLKVYVLGYLALELLRAGMSDYLAAGKIALLVQGRLNDKLSLGDVGWFLRNDPRVGKALRDYGFKVDEISKALFTINLIRNRAIHNGRCSLAEVERLRTVLLGENTVFKLLWRPPENRS